MSVKLTVRQVGDVSVVDESGRIRCSRGRARSVRQFVTVTGATEGTVEPR